MNQIILIIFLLKFVSSEHSSQIQVSTKSGNICGMKQLIDGKELHVFLGIPYAQPPTNELRFKKPIPVEPWNETIHAIDWPNPCYQLSVQKTFINPNMSEDCLYMNIFAPKSDTKLPVIIWIHGGGLEFDTSTGEGTIPTVLSTRGNVITVSINYRLNTFGFLYAANDDAPGNVGLYDQVMAIQWTNDNIEFFGGDKSRITLFGQSAGATSVSLHIASPLSRHLFKNAVLIGGVSLGKLFIDDKNITYRGWIKGAEILGCGNGITFTSEAMECLRNLHPQELTKLPNLEDVIKEVTNTTYFPCAIYGDEFLPENPYIMYENGNFNKTITVFAGFNNDERAHQLLTDDPIVYGFEYNFTFQDATEQMDYVVNALKYVIPINSSEISKLYFTGINHNDPNALRRAIGFAYGDFEVTCPMLKFLKLMVNRQNKVYQYYLTQRPSDSSLALFDCPKWAQLCHRSDLIYWFGNPFLFPEKFTENDRKVSNILMSVLSYFAYYSSLPPQNNIKWSNYYLINDEAIAPYYEFPSLAKPDGYFGMNIKYPECDVWDNHINY